MAGSDRASTGSSAYADSGKYASWGRSSDGGSSRKGKEKEDGNHLTVFRRRGRKSGGFLMANLFEQQQEQPAERASPRKSRLSANVSNGDGGAPLDPTQLVQMALSLSEGRRRHASAGLQLPPPTTDTRRIRSTGVPAIHVSAGSPLANDVMQPASLDDDDDDDYRQSIDQQVEPVDYDFSQATLHRAERARKFFELSSEYRRFLSHLPPLKPVNSAAADTSFRSLPSPPLQQNQKELGRQYNPLQLLRNRKARHREQRPLDPPAEAYDNVPKVKSYIDDIEQEASDAAYRASMDTALLPCFGRVLQTHDSPPAQITRSRKRTDTAVSKIVRPENDWSFTPAELLADAVWLLQAENRACIENRHGHRIFPQRPRSSFESARSGRKSADSRPSFSRADTWGSLVKSDDETDRGRKKPKFLSIRHVDNTARKHLFRNRSRSSSASSCSSARPANRKKHMLGPGDDPDLDNTGPLERQMKKLMEKESLGHEEASPDFISPDKWDRGHDPPATDPNVPPILEESPSTHNHKRNDSSKTDGTVDEQARSSYDNSTAPSSPVVAHHIPSFGMSLSPPASRQSSPERKFGLFRMSRNPSDDKVHRTDFAAASQASLLGSRHVSDNVDPPRSSLDSLHPPAIKRHRTTNSISNALFNPGRRTSKDVGVGRFFKSGRIGDLVRSDSSRQNERSRKKDQQIAPDMSDSGTDVEEQDDENPRKMPPASRSHSSVSQATLKDNQKPKLHNPNLPTFKSRNESDAEQDPIARQNRMHREESRSSRFDRLAPPRINLPREASSVSPTRKTPISRYSSDDGSRSDQDFLTPLRKKRSPNHAGTFETSLPTIDNSSPERNASPAKRHWSISDHRTSSQDRRDDEQDQSSPTPSNLDISRIRALYLSSGIKAHEIVSRANATATPPSPFFLLASKTANQGVHPVCLKEEFTVAARMLHHTITVQTSCLSSSIADFRTSKIPDLHHKIQDLRHKIDEKFTPLVHGTADEADAFTVALTTQQTLAVKQVNDAIDGVLRRRRRKLIFVQRLSWKFVEWVLLGVMWGLWFAVVIIRAVRGVVGGVVGGVRWLLWL